jgi:hypothetical protein
MWTWQSVIKIVSLVTNKQLMGLSKLCALPGRSLSRPRLYRSLKKSFLRPQFPSAAEAATDFAALAARLEAAPLQNMNETRVFPQPV